MNPKTRWLGNQSTIDNVPNRRCLPPTIVKAKIDLSSTLPYYDEKGFPKRHAPTRLNASGEWLYALSPYKDHPPLSGVMKILHMNAIEALKEQKRLGL